MSQAACVRLGLPQKSLPDCLLKGLSMELIYEIIGPIEVLRTTGVLTLISFPAVLMLGQRYLLATPWRSLLDANFAVEMWKPS